MTEITKEILLSLLFILASIWYWGITGPYHKLMCYLYGHKYEKFGYALDEEVYPIYPDIEYYECKRCWKFKMEKK